MVCGATARIYRPAHVRPKLAKPAGRFTPCAASPKQHTAKHQPNRTLWSAAVFIAAGLPAPPSMAEDATYNAASQSEFLSNLAGIAYIILVGFFLYRVFTRRAKRFKEEVRDSIVSDFV
jgi:hypothetical protein